MRGIGLVAQKEALAAGGAGGLLFGTVTIDLKEGLDARKVDRYGGDAKQTKGTAFDTAMVELEGGV